MQYFFIIEDSYNYAFVIDIGLSDKGDKDWPLLFLLFYHRFAASAARTMIMDTVLPQSESKLTGSTSRSVMALMFPTSQ
jgi:hypothetical protein